MERLNQVDTKNAMSRQVFTIDGRKFSNMKGFLSRSRGCIYR